MPVPDRFPTLDARRLTGEDVILPDGLDGDPIVVAVAFRMWQQRQVDSWVPWVDSLRADHPALAFYEVPVLGSWWRPARGFIDGGMRSGIGDADVCHRTLTVYTNPLRVAAALGLTTLQIGVYVLRPDGTIAAGARGSFTESAAARLESDLVTP